MRLMPKFYLLWDEWNLNHIAKHGVSRVEVETALKDEKLVLWKHRGRYRDSLSPWKNSFDRLGKLRDFLLCYNCKRCKNTKKIY